jgi:hypothetical protein
LSRLIKILNKYSIKKEIVLIYKTLQEPKQILNYIYSSFKANNMPTHKIFQMPFARIYPLYIAKVERKGKTQAEVDEVIFWLTGYNQKSLQKQIDSNNDMETFFAQAPKLNPNRHLITGVICGWRVEEMEEGLMKEIRYMDKIIDELAKGKRMEKILRK